MTLPGKTPEEPGASRQADGPPGPPQPLEEENWRELQEPHDLPYPDGYDLWLPGPPEYAIVVGRLRGWQPGGPPSLAEVLETGRTREPDPDLEAEP